MLTAFLAAFGRAIAEVGAIIIVGGNIAGFTRTMTTAIALETSKGDLPLALGLGLILLSLSIAVSTVALLLVGRIGGKIAAASAAVLENLPQSKWCAMRIPASSSPLRSS